MALPGLMAIGGGLLGAIKHGQQVDDYNRQMALASQLSRWSPYTGMQVDIPKSRPDFLTNVAEGSLSGFGLGNNINDLEQKQEITDLWKKGYAKDHGIDLSPAPAPLPEVVPSPEVAPYKAQPSSNMSVATRSPYSGSLRSRWSSPIAPMVS